MAKTKHQKSKPNKQSHAKKHGKQADISEFRAQLDALGLKIIQVTADGNCFFRALGDQLEGNEEEHEKYRDMTVKYIRNNRDTFEPFIEDDVPFDEYCESMEKDGTWAGHMELQAASLVTHTNICIHRHMSPRWYIQNFDNRESRMLHLSYHDGEHYNSIRLKEDSCTGPASPIIIKADADLSAKSREVIAAAKSKGDTGRNIVQVGSVKVVMAGSGCDDREKVKQVLQQVGGDVDAALEFLIAEQGSEDQLNANDNISCLASTPQGEHDTKSGDSPCEKGSSDCSAKGASDKHTSQEDEKKIPRNKACPCGSKKKYKSCCGSVAGKQPTSYTVNHTMDYGKGRRDKKQGKKVPPVNVTSSKQSDARPPDMGALCI
ncbi:OVARIAN TUMOR DOMAIN-containing deubiquitinating enzyme 7 isoform X2 [Lycium barbarum]|uniref:OVARIAN TUMOR DOMAIN-containing deubiquitinating enzyme 7 isoform X2 n=1 Tax=Lycium barbarum TaxID=112863 RepID=UPI00293EA94C|nr:OVARIAN TUMOR DOMAIN-containing deubiquitinating enzyme 7 isoform X2 [Lycium barbarum]